MEGPQKENGPPRPVLALTLTRSPGKESAAGVWGGGGGRDPHRGHPHIKKEPRTLAGGQPLLTKLNRDRKSALYQHRIPRWSKDDLGG